MKNQRIYPQTLFGQSQNVYKTPKVLNFARFIQSIDDDGNIETSINITQTMRDKISALKITSIDWTSEKVVLDILKELNVTIRNKDEVERHLLVHSKTPYIEKENLTFTVNENTEINNEINKLTILAPQDINEIKISDEDKKEREYFSISADGSITLKKKLNYKKQHTHSFTIQGEGKQTSNYVTITVHVMPSDQEEAEPIDPPTIVYADNNSILYTNTPNYTVNIQGRKETNIYWEDKKIAVMPNEGITHLPRNIDIKDKEQKYSIKLGYDNKIESPNVTLKVWYDDQKPVFVTVTQILVPENTKLTKAIDVNDTLKNHGLLFELDGGADKDLFRISLTTGLLEFKVNVDYENRQDSNQDNIYEVSVKVTDKAGNFNTKLFKIKVENEETNPTIENKSIKISDSKRVNDLLGQIVINTEDSTIISIKLFDEDKKYFRVTNDGKIWLKRKVYYQSKNRHTFRIQVTNHREKVSNIATVSIKVVSAEIDIMNDILPPTLITSTIYTKLNNYNLTLKGRYGTKIFINNLDTGYVIPFQGELTISTSTLNYDSNTKYSLTLGYENGVKSEPSFFTVIKDTIAPSILTSSTLSIEENIEIVENINATDTNKEYGLTYTVSGIDNQYFNISESGELSFKTKSDFENPLDSGRNNVYDVTLTVTDRAGNSSFKYISIEVLDVLDSKPSIEAFEEDITVSTTGGTTIGIVDINEGNSPLLDVNITGNGSDNFYINRNGTLILLNQLDSTQIYTLTINARNEFGTISSNITINIVNFEKIAQVQIEHRVSNATVKLFKINSDNTQELIYTTSTKVTGNFDIKPSLLENDELYIYEVTDGYDNEQENKGVIRLITKGSWVKSSTKKIIISPLSEMIYDYVAKYVKYDYSQIESKLNEYTDLLLNKDLNEDYQIDAQDFLHFDIEQNKDSLSYTLKYNNTYQSLSQKIKANDNEYYNELFHAYTVNAFIANDVEVQDSIVFAIDIEHNGEFRIYDFDTKDIIGQLKLTSTISNPSSSQIPKLYIDKENQRVYISNIYNNTYIIDISNLKKPTLLGTYYDSGNRILGNIGKTIFYQHYDMENNVIDFTNPMKPVPLDFLENIRLIEKNKAYLLSYAFTSNTTKKIKVMDILNPKNIKPLYEIDTTDSSFGDPLIQDNYLYLIFESYIKIFSIDTFGNTSFIWKTPSTNIDLRGNILGIKNNIIYLESYQTITLISIEDREKPFIKNIIKNSISYTNNFKIIDNYLMNEGEIIYLKKFISQNHRALYSRINTWGQLENIVNDTLYFITNTGTDIQEINIQNPLKGYLNNSYKLEKNSFLSNSGNSNSANLNVIKNNKLYTMKDYNLLEIYDITNLNQAINTIQLEINATSSLISALWINNSFVYISTNIYLDTQYQSTILQKFDISNTNSSRLIGTLSLSNPINNISFSNNILGITVGLEGIYLVDWSKNIPTILDKYKRNRIEYSEPAYFSQVILKNNLLYVTVEGKYIEIFDTNNKTLNFITSYKETNAFGYINEIYIEDNLLYYISSIGISILDISDTYTIKLLRHDKYSIDIPSFIKKENLIYSVDNWNHDGISVIDLDLFKRLNL